MTTPLTTPLTTPWFLGVELLFLAVAHVYGGPPWTVLAVLAFVAEAYADPRGLRLPMLALGLAWLALFRVTGNRELFFPYAMYLASHVALLLASRRPWAGWLGGGIMAAAFLLIRGLQSATARVLAIECAVAAVILAVALAAHGSGCNRPVPTAALVVVSSVAAWAALAL